MAGPDADDPVLGEHQLNQELNRALATSKVQQLLEAMKKLGCGVDTRTYFKVCSCGLQAGGGYSPENGVILCQDQLKTPEQTQSTILHELIHAYDDCRARPQGGIDWTDCHAHACTEVRAAALSGDCDWSQESYRGNVSVTSPSTWSGFFERCVARRAALSLGLNQHCKDPQGVVRDVMSRCLADEAPWGEAPQANGGSTTSSSAPPGGTQNDNSNHKPGDSTTTSLSAPPGGTRDVTNNHEPGGRTTSSPAPPVAGATRDGKNNYKEDAACLTPNAVAGGAAAQPGLGTVAQQTESPQQQGVPS